MNTTLTTFDGFPRADIDVAQIRTTRARIIRLKNDHKAVMEKLEDAVIEHFQQGKSIDAASATPLPSVQAVATEPAAEGGSQQQSTPAIEPPFARVNSVVEGSPAETAGMKAGDKVIKFGSANWTNHERLGRVAQVVQQNENRAIAVKVLRDTQTVQLELTPRRNWGGRSLLGCHLVPL